MVLLQTGFSADFRIADNPGSAHGRVPVLTSRRRSSSIAASNPSFSSSGQVPNSVLTFAIGRTLCERANSWIVGDCQNDRDIGVPFGILPLNRFQMNAGPSPDHVPTVRPFHHASILNLITQTSSETAGMSGVWIKIYASWRKVQFNRNYSRTESSRCASLCRSSLQSKNRGILRDRVRKVASIRDLVRV